MNTIPLFLTPFAAGVQSCRHRIVLRRAESHLLKAVALYYPIVDQVKPTLSEEQQAFLSTKIMLVQHAIDELEQHAALHPSTSIKPRLKVAKRALRLVQRLLEDDPE
ncbi:uncharacterized protein K460DRAFT_405835 [Cucurbitaria berberidis CBS 394.84]|uniref:Uncharacterized protein n=1 Tax=Cucurbitaria berberidis CBS 394.84 TaxID=1168544 RepID=A0A9P4L826_9PLEO|nr:uncharacterized protein K460DRAFT_405835 [Cucurbitaria berberidis CBS 394.84]KAF1845585.1 hypothetical protein K460DRAFT_405835 [Cucurbitaria berberidis CBS 394.84]